MGFLNKKKTEVGFVANNKKAKSELQNIGSSLSELTQVAGSQAKLAGGRASDLAHEGIDWAQPRLQNALEEISRASNDAADRGKKAAGKAAKQTKGQVRKNRKKLEADYLPRVQRALEEAAEAARSDKSLGAKAQEVGRVTQRALTEPTPKKKAKTGGKVFGWVLVGTLAAGAGYLLWRRTQPTEDPWAEEYWDDAKTTTPAPVGTIEGSETTVSQTTGTTPGHPADDGDNAAKDAIVTEERAEDATAADEVGNTSSNEPNDGRKLGEI